MYRMASFNGKLEKISYSLIEKNGYLLKLYDILIADENCSNI